MSSISPIRNPKTDALITPENAALVIIDYQPTQVHSVNSTDTASLVKGILNAASIAKLYRLPIVLSTVNVTSGRSQDTISALRERVGDIPSYDRTTINAWEDEGFYEAVKETGRKKLIMCALWTEACLTFPSLDALREGYEVYPLVDAVGGTSKLAHKTALRRLEQAGAKLITTPQLACELQRDWNRSETVAGFTQALFDTGAFVKL